MDSRLLSSLSSAISETSKATYLVLSHMPALSPVSQKFVLHWGEMGSRWGINRTVAQIHALLYISNRPLNADEICEALEVARSNVSTSLRELQNWGIVKVVHVKGDRRDHFESMRDVMEMFRIIVAERKRREIDPTIAILKDCVAEAEQGGDEEAFARQQLAGLRESFELGSAWFDQVNKIPSQKLVKIMKRGDKVLRLIV
jgi:DNA-binding transcriptional regulator GbsR (MarR family)